MEKFHADIEAIANLEENILIAEDEYGNLYFAENVPENAYSPGDIVDIELLHPIGVLPEAYKSIFEAFKEDM